MKAANRKVLVTVAISMLCAAILGCGTTPSWQTRPPALLPILASEVQAPPLRLSDSGVRRPVIALVLGGGGLRGFAHVGVLRALQEQGIRPEIVVGTSAGAVVGAAYASGKSWPEIDEAARKVKVSSLVDLALSASGLIRGDKLARWVDSVTGPGPIERFPIRFAAVATDLQSQRAMVLDRGSAGRAVQASAAVPGINVPVAYAGGHLVDGGVASLVPVRIARAMGADLVIAVDIYCNEPAARGLDAPAVLFNVMHSQSCRIAGPEMKEADILIEPRVGAIKMSDQAQQDRAIEVGYRAALAALVGASFQ